MDRFFRGLLAGIIGGVLMNIWNFFSYYVLQIPEQRYLDWASIMLYGSFPNNFTEAIFALLAHLMWVGFLGIIFAYLIPKVTSRGYLIKGAFWGFISGFVIYSIPVLFDVHYLADTRFGTSISNFVGGIIWGTTTAQTLKWFDKLPLRN